MLSSGGRARLTANRFAELEHVLVAPFATSQRSVVDVLLEKRGLSRRVTRVVMSFSLVLPRVAGSDRAAVLPRSLADAYARTFGLKLHAVPLPVPPAEISLAWYLGNERDPKHVWTRQLMHDAARAAGLRTA